MVSNILTAWCSLISLTTSFGVARTHDYDEITHWVTDQLTCSWSKWRFLWVDLTSLEGPLKEDEASGRWDLLERPTCDELPSGPHGNELQVTFKRQEQLLADGQQEKGDGNHTAMRKWTIPTLSEPGREPRDSNENHSLHRHLISAWGDPAQGTHWSCERINVHCS